MPKIIEPQMGMPADLCIEELEYKKEKGTLSDSRVLILEESSKLLSDIRRRVSLEACLNPVQRKAVADDYLEAVSEICQADDEKKLPLLKERARQIATYINSCRLSCKNCMKESCARRDGPFPRS